VDLFNKILVPLDGSKYSERALKVAINIAKKFQSEITLIDVYSIEMPTSIKYVRKGSTGKLRRYSDVFKTTKKAIHRERYNILTKDEKKVKAEGIPVEISLVEGNVVHEILKKAVEGKFDLIIMGAKGAHKLRGWLIGHVSEKVVRKARCPVLVIR
jgi:nucleotide-binding universal stress UspA family protein